VPLPNKLSSHTIAWEVKYFVALFDFQDLNHMKSYEEIEKLGIDDV
jgi:hypothetical protein